MSRLESFDKRRRHATTSERHHGSRRRRGWPRHAIPIATFVLLLGAARGSLAAGGADPLQALGCGGCHLLAAPPAGARTLDAYAKRKGPDLFYAGSKFRPEWLRAWLVRPTPIRPAGLRPAERSRTSEAGDVLLDGAPEAHPAVAAGDVDVVVKALARLDWGRDRLPSTTPARVAVPKALAEMNFVKFKGCGSCHRTTREQGPAAGPELADAYARLRPEFLASYIASPQAWDPVAPMPGYGLEPGEVGKLVEYLRLIGEDDHGAKGS